MQLSLYLDKPQRSTTSVLLNVALGGKRFRFGTGVTLEPKHWNAERQTVRSSDPQRNAHQKRLEALMSHVRSVYNDLTPSGKVHLLSASDYALFQERIRSFLAPAASKPVVKGSSFFGAWDEFIETYTIRTPNGMVTTRRPGARMQSLYRLVVVDLKNWEASQRSSITFDSIDEVFYGKYCDWLSSKRNLVDATISNHIKVIKCFMKWSRSKGLHTNSAWETFWRDKRTGDTIALSVDELRRMRDTDLSDKPRLNRTRDIFLLQTFTGLRYGDLLHLEQKHIDAQVGVIRFSTEKTGATCIIPITTPLQALLDKHTLADLSMPSNVKMNAALKELGQLIGLDQETTVTEFRAGKRVEGSKKRHELLTTHVARRTFVTTSIRFGVPESIISAVTGHAKKGMLQQHYIVLQEEDIRDVVCKAWEQL